MPIFVLFIALSFAFYVFYKVKFFRTKLPLERKWLSGKSSIALGSLVFFYGLNQIFLRQTTLTYVIAAIFMIIGVASIWGGYKNMKFFLPLAIEEAEEAARQKSK